MAIRALVGEARSKRPSSGVLLQHLSVAAFLAIGVSSCGRSHTPPTVHPILSTTPVDSIEITPWMLVVAKPATGTPEPTSFQLEAMLRDKDGRIIPALVGKDVSWHAYEDGIASGAVTLSPNGHTVIVEVPAFPANNKNITIKAEVEGVWSDPGATINLVAHSGTGPDIGLSSHTLGVTANAAQLTVNGQDIILSSHTPGATANIAMVDGEEAGATCLIDSTYVFVNEVLLADLVKGCESDDGEVAVFSPDRRLYYEPQQPFAPDQDIVDSGSPDPQFDTLSVKLWSAAYQSGITDDSLLHLRENEGVQAELDVQSANAILQANRVGIVLEVVGSFAEIIEGDALLNGCPSTQSDVVGGVLNVYIVAAAPGLGAHCIRQPTQPQDVIFLTQTRYSPTMIAHEVGHALALWKPGVFGHTEDLKGFGTNNVMLGGEADSNAETRDHFSLGQAFRMNVDEDSWLNHSVGKNAAGDVMAGTLARAAVLPRLTCQCATYVTTPCPKLAKDLSPDTDLPPGEPWKCADIIYFMQAEKHDDVVGLMRGRQWLSGFGVCEWLAGMPARYDEYAWGQPLLEFPNVAESSCAEEGFAGFLQDFAVFFTHHAMWYRAVPDDPGLSYQFWDVISLGEVPDEPWKVPVVVWVEDSDQEYDATEDRAVADTVYGGVLDDGTSNRTGITLDWTSKGQPDDWDTTPNSLKDKLANALNAGTCNMTGTSVMKGSINVYFLVKPEHFVTGGDFEFMAQDLGAACMDPTSGSYIIALAATPSPINLAAAPNPTRSTTGLAHYLGHLFALPDAAATDHSIMRHVPLVDGQERALGLTLGQVFRLNVGKDSWLNTSSESGRKGQPTEKCSPAQRVRKPSPETDDDSSLQNLNCPPIDMHVTGP